MDSIRAWIFDYLIRCGEDFGADLAAVPASAKSKKVQLIEVNCQMFLTFNSTENDDCTWAKLSDKSCKIPARFSREAMADYNKTNKKRLTEHKTAIISIKQFHPFFARIPLGYTKGMSEKACLALEIGSFTIIGGVGEGKWGDPQEVETNEHLLLWSEGLRQHGGAGNVLMDKKKEREDVTKTLPVEREDTRQPDSKPSLQVSKKPASLTSEHMVIERPHRVSNTNLLEEYERRWKPVHENPWPYILRPVPVEKEKLGVESVLTPSAPEHDSNTVPLPGPSRHVLDLGSSPPASPASSVEHDPLRGSSPIEMQTTPPPEEWPSSFRSTRIDYESVHTSSDDEEDSDSGSDQNSSITPPGEGNDQLEPPSQAALSLSNVNPPHLPLTPPRRQKPYSSTLFVPVSSVEVNTLSPTTSSILPNARRKVTRKVPYPVQPSRHSPTSPARILVPNSDTSGQSQSQSHPHPEQPSKSKLSPRQPVFPQEEKEQSHSKMAIGGEGDPSCQLLSPPNSYDGDRSSPVQPVFQDHNRERMSKDDDEKPHELPHDAMVRNRYQRSKTYDDETHELPHSTTSPQTEEVARVVSAPSQIKLDDDDAQTDRILFGNTYFNNAEDARPQTGQDNSDGNQVRKAREKSRESSSHQSTLPSDTRAIWTSNNSPSIQPIHDTKQAASIVARGVSSQSRSSAVQHDAKAWKNPTFMTQQTARKKATSKIEESDDTDSVTERGSTSPDRGPALVDKHVVSSRSSHSHLSSPGSETSARLRIPAQSAAQSSSHHLQDKAGSSSGSTDAVRASTRSTPRRDLANTNRGSFKRRLGDVIEPSRKRRKEQDVDSESRVSDSRRQDDDKKVVKSNGARRNATRTQEHPGSSNHPVRVKDEPADGTVSIPTQRKLKGFSVDFDHIPCDEKDAPRFTWDWLAQILLRTGRHRSQGTRESGGAG